MAYEKVDMSKPVPERLGFDPKSVKKLSFLEMLKKVGPGIIATGIVIGPGNITTSAMLGANYGYTMMWLADPRHCYGHHFHHGIVSDFHYDRNACHSRN